MGINKMLMKSFCSGLILLLSAYGYKVTKKVFQDL